jgi:pimeloyl-ACP methyl ester carboxylesterase
MIRLPDGRRLGYGEWGDPHGQPLLYCHGWPGWRAEGQFGNQAAKARGVRLIAPDRPGMGLSDFQPRRRFLHWPDDVTRLADTLGLERSRSLDPARWHRRHGPAEPAAVWDGGSAAGAGAPTAGRDGGLGNYRARPFR